MVIYPWKNSFLEIPNSIENEDISSRKQKGTLYLLLLELEVYLFCLTFVFAKFQKSIKFHNFLDTQPNEHLQCGQEIGRCFHYVIANTKCLSILQKEE